MGGKKLPKIPVDVQVSVHWFSGLSDCSVNYCRVGNAAGVEGVFIIVEPPGESRKNIESTNLDADTVRQWSDAMLAKWVALQCTDHGLIDPPRTTMRIIVAAMRWICDSVHAIEQDGAS